MAGQEGARTRLPLVASAAARRHRGTFRIPGEEGRDIGRPRRIHRRRTDTPITPIAPVPETGLEPPRPDSGGSCLSFALEPNHPAWAAEVIWIDTGAGFDLCQATREPTEVR